MKYLINEKGQAFVEYAMLIAAVAIVVFAILQAFGVKTSGLYPTLQGL